TIAAEERHLGRAFPAQVAQIPAASNGLQGREILMKEVGQKPAGGSNWQPMLDSADKLSPEDAWLRAFDERGSYSLLIELG
ncbi:MAG: hypothetical protein NTW99_01115, partial [Chloroflexi bacterium]|nr:hypothetical protein [Chloroflexota bacterium]